MAATEYLQEACVAVTLTPHQASVVEGKLQQRSSTASDSGFTSLEKVKAVLDWPRPQSIHDIKSFSRLASYYRKFIEGLSQLAKPLTDLTRDTDIWRWGDAEVKSFTALKLAMATAPVLRLPDFKNNSLLLQTRVMLL